MKRRRTKQDDPAQLKAEDAYYRAMSLVESRLRADDEDGKALVKGIRDLVRSNREFKKWGIIYSMSWDLRQGVESATTESEFHSVLRTARASHNEADE